MFMETVGLRGLHRFASEPPQSEIILAQPDKGGQSRSGSPRNRPALGFFQGGRNRGFLAQALGYGDRSLQRFR